MGAYYVHHGFVYGSKLAFVLFLVVRSLAAVRSAFDVASIVLVIEVEGGAEALHSFAPASYFGDGRHIRRRRSCGAPGPRE